MTPNAMQTGPGGGVRIFEALTGEEILARIRLALEKLYTEIEGLPDFNHPVTFPEFRFHVLASVTTWPLEEGQKTWTVEDQAALYDDRGRRVAQGPGTTETVEEVFATGADPERIEGESVIPNQAPDEIRQDLGRPVPVLRRKGKELVTEPEAPEVLAQPAPVQRPPEDPDHSPDAQESRPRGRGVTLDHGGPRLKAQG